MARDRWHLRAGQQHMVMSVNDIPPMHAAQILKQHGLHAVKSLGQNFLDDPAALEQVANAADIQPADTVLEVGPGLGSLTRHLSVLARDVVAVELDKKLMPVLKGLLKNYRNVRVVEGDILQISPSALGLQDNYIVAANIPYNITSALLRHLLSSQPKPRRMVLTIQQEVAERVCSAPPRMSLLSLSVQVYGTPSIVAKIPAEAFYPVPNVDSAIVRIEIAEQPAIEAGLLPTFFDLIKAGFAQKRKTLRNALSAGLRMPPAEAGKLLQEADIDPQRRAETLSLVEWERLAKVRQPE